MSVANTMSINLVLSSGLKGSRRSTCSAYPSTNSKSAESIFLCVCLVFVRFHLFRMGLLSNTLFRSINVCCIKDSESAFSFSMLSFPSRYNFNIFFRSEINPVAAHSHTCCGLSALVPHVCLAFGLPIRACLCSESTPCVFVSVRTQPALRLRQMLAIAQPFGLYTRCDIPFHL